MALVIEALGEATFERAAALVASEHAAARQVRPELPAGFGDAAVCEAALRHLCGSGHHGLVATNGYQWVSVDFETANPLSRPFWLDAGFRPTGYGLFRVIEPRR